MLNQNWSSTTHAASPSAFKKGLHWQVFCSSSHTIPWLFCIAILTLGHGWSDSSHQWFLQLPFCFPRFCFGFAFYIRWFSCCCWYWVFCHLHKQYQCLWAQYVHCHLFANPHWHCQCLNIAGTGQVMSIGHSMTLTVNLSPFALMLFMFCNRLWILITWPQTITILVPQLVWWLCIPVISSTFHTTPPPISQCSRQFLVCNFIMPFALRSPCLPLALLTLCLIWPSTLSLHSLYTTQCFYLIHQFANSW